VIKNSNNNISTSNQIEKFYQDNNHYHQVNKLKSSQENETTLTFKQVALLPNISVESRYSHEAQKLIAESSEPTVYGRSPVLLIQMA